MVCQPLHLSESFSGDRISACGKTSDLQDLAQPCTRLCKSSASPLATYVMISWQVRAFSQPSCPTTTWAATIFDMYHSTIDMQVKQQKSTQGDMSIRVPQNHAFGWGRWCKVKTWEVSSDD